MFGKKRFYSIGLDIDASHVKGAIIVYENKACRLEKILWIPKEDLLAQGIPSSYKISSAVLCIPDTLVITKKFSLSAVLTDLEKEDYLWFEMEKFALVPANELYLDFQIVGPSDTEQHMLEIVCAVVRRQTIDPWLNALAGIKVTAVHLASQISEDLWPTTTPEFFKACTLASNVFSNQPLKLNLLPWRQEKRQHQKKMAYYYAIAVVLMALLSTLISHIFWQQSMEQKQQQRYQQTLVANTARDLQQKMAEQQQYRQQREQLIRIIDDLPHYFPDQVYLTQLDYHDNMLVLTGTSPSQHAILTLIKRLQKSAFITVNNEYQWDNHHFTLQLTVRHD